jgi:FkbM family methyltransferase
LAVLIAIFGFGSGASPFLRLEHSIRMQLADHSKVAALDVPGISGLKMFLHPKDKVITYRVMADGLWEENETHWVSQFVGEGDTFVDIGANVGYFTLVASRLVGENGHVYAFEPDPVAFSILQRNVRLNGLDNVTLEQKAVSNEPGSIQLFLSEENKGNHQIYETEEKRLAIDVEAVPLDDYFRDYDGDIDFIKIDTQGAEGVIVQGMDEVLRANPQAVMAVEFWPTGLSGLGTDAADFLALLRSYDFLFFDLGPGSGGIRPLHEVHDKGLLHRFVGKGDHFTNLFVIRGYAEVQEVAWEALRKGRVLRETTPELTAAQAKWETEMLAEIDRDGSRAASLPEGLAGILSKENARRTPEEAQAVRTYFRSVTPMLSEARAQAELAKVKLLALKESILDARKRPKAADR